MKILIINGSRKNGNTLQLANALVDSIRRNEPASLEVIHLSDLNMGFCSSCHGCFKSSEEICKDAAAVRAPRDAMDLADLTIVATPVYALQVSGLVKNWLDHFAYIMHRPRYYDKRAVIVTTTAGAGTGSVVKYIRQLLPMWGVNTVYPLTATLFAEDLMIDRKLQGRISFLADTIVNDFRGRKYRRPSFYHLSIHTVFRVMNHLYSPGYVERLYWESNGLKDPVYPGPSKLGALKSIYGKFLFRTMYRSLAKKQFP